jgi:hypothetical protein
MAKLKGGTTIAGNEATHRGNFSTVVLDNSNEILEAIKAIDGAGSGLDADTLDGLQGSSFLRSNTDDAMYGNLSMVEDNPYLSIKTSGNGNAHLRFQESSGVETALIYSSPTGQLNLRVGKGTQTHNFNDDGSVILRGDLDVIGQKLKVGSNTENGAEIELDTSNAGSPQISMSDNGGDNRWAIGADDADNNFAIHGSTTVLPTINNITNPHFEITTSGVLYATGNKIWHAGNDGSGSGLDADLLDGLDGLYYKNELPQTTFTVSADISEALAGDTRFPHLNGFRDGSGSISYEVAQQRASSYGARLPTIEELEGHLIKGSGFSYDTETTWSSTSAGIGYVWGIDGSGDSVRSKLSIETDSAVTGFVVNKTSIPSSMYLDKIKEVDGVGSGLDADKLNGLGLPTDRNNEGSKVVKTNGAGEIDAGWINTTSGDVGTNDIIDFYIGTDDGYIRKATKQHVADQLGPLMGGGGGSDSQTATVQATALGGNSGEIKIVRQGSLVVVNGFINHDDDGGFFSFGGIPDWAQPTNTAQVLYMQAGGSDAYNKSVNISNAGWIYFYYIKTADGTSYVDGGTGAFTITYSLL